MKQTHRIMDTVIARAEKEFEALKRNGESDEDEDNNKKDEQKQKPFIVNKTPTD